MESSKINIVSKTLNLDSLSAILTAAPHLVKIIFPLILRGSADYLVPWPTGTTAVFQDTFQIFSSGMWSA